MYIFDIFHSFEMTNFYVWNIRNIYLYIFAYMKHIFAILKYRFYMAKIYTHIYV